MNENLQSLLASLEGASLKRIAWAFGCAKAGGDVEHALYVMLRERFAKVIGERALEVEAGR